MKIRLNEDKEIVNTVREGLKKTRILSMSSGTYPEDTKCICKEFKEQVEDPNFSGYCHCLLYYKEKE